MAAVTAQLTQFITMVSAPAGIADTGAHLYHLTTGTIDRREEGCRPNCPYKEMHLLGADALCYALTDPQGERVCLVGEMAIL